MDAQESVGRREAFDDCVSAVEWSGCYKVRIRSKRMANNIAITDDIKAVERWENEGGKVSSSPLGPSLKSYKTEPASRERRFQGFRDRELDLPISPCDFW